MTVRLTLEPGPREIGTACDCCGERSMTVHGFVYKAGDAFAIYYAGWSYRHPERGVSLAIATGEWAEGTSPRDRVSIGLEAHSTEAEIQLTVIGPERSAWGETPLFGKMLSRAEALANPSLKVALEIGELILRDDPRVHGALHGSY